MARYIQPLKNTPHTRAFADDITKIGHVLFKIDGIKRVFSASVEKDKVIENDTQEELLEALYWMYIQYCGKDGHLFMGAGETAGDILEEYGYLKLNTDGTIIKDLKHK